MPSPTPSPQASRSTSQSPSADMVATMGFTSFGAKPNPPKKRKRLDPSNEGSGTNNTPLGFRSRIAPTQEQGQNQSQGEEREEGQGQEWSAPNGLTPREKVLDVEATEEVRRMMLETGGVPQDPDYDRDQPRYVEDGAEGVVASRSGAPGASVGTVPVGNIGHLRGIGEGGGWGLGAGKRGNGEWDWQALRRGVRDERGDMAFYDASFVEDPWRGLRGDGKLREHGGGVMNST